MGCTNLCKHCGKVFGEHWAPGGWCAVEEGQQHYGKRFEIAEELCKWTEDCEGGLWESTCGRMFQFNDGGVKENEFKFCYYCGKPIEAFPYEEDTDDRRTDMAERP